MDNTTENNKMVWQFRNALSNDWGTDNRAMNNPKIKTFADYENHVNKLNKKHNASIECRLHKMI